MEGSKICAPVSGVATEDLSPESAKEGGKANSPTEEVPNGGSSANREKEGGKTVASMEEVSTRGLSANPGNLWANPSEEEGKTVTPVEGVSPVDPLVNPGKEGTKTGKGKGKGIPPGKAPAPPPPPNRKPKAPFTGPKLKPLFWSTVTNVNKEASWALATEGPGAVKFDEMLIENLFGLPETSNTSPCASRRSQPESGNDRKRRRIVRVLDDRTSQQLAIALCRLPPPDKFAAMVNTFEGFPWDFTPTAGAVHALQVAYEKNWDAIEKMRQQLEQDENDSAVLDLPERFLWELDQVPNVSAKLSCGSLVLGSSDLPEWRSGLAKVGICCQQLRGSKSLARCLATCLSVGNFLNRGTPRAEARAVVLPESLLKLAEIRSTATSPSKSEKAVSVLQVITRALLEEEATRGESGHFARSVQSLLDHAQSAACIGLEEIFRVMPAKTKEVQDIERKLADIEDAGPGAKRVEMRIRQIVKEANLAARLADGARQEWEVTQKWACSRTKMACESWFALWVEFLGKLRVYIEDETKRREGPSATLTSSKSCPDLSNKRSAQAAPAVQGLGTEKRQASSSSLVQGPRPQESLASILKASLPKKIVGGG